MALSATTLAGLIKSKLLADGDSAAVDNEALTALCACIAEACVEHITAAAVVTVPALGLISPGGMTPAPVTGTATGTVA